MKQQPRVVTTNSHEETEELGAEFAQTLKPGSVVALFGELGAGKTCFTKGIAKGLGIKDYVKSPSFVIVISYGADEEWSKSAGVDKSKGGRLPLHHIDLYRIASGREADELGLEEYLYGRGVCVIEWAERAPDALPDDTINVTLTYEGESRRRIEIERVGENGD